MVSRSTQSFILPRVIKWVPGMSGNLVVRTKLPPWSGSSLETVEPYPQKGTIKFVVFYFYFFIIFFFFFFFFFVLKFYIISAKGAYESANLVKFQVSSQNSDILHFDRFLLPKSYKLSAKKLQNSYLSWHWRVM